MSALVAEISDELLEDLIGLVHPDRHPPERAERANRATSNLLNLRDRLRPAAVAEPVPADGRLELPGAVRTASRSGLVITGEVYLLSMYVHSVAEGSSLTLFDTTTGEGNASSGELRPIPGRRWLGIPHRAGCYARIRGAMRVTFVFLR